MVALPYIERLPGDPRPRPTSSGLDRWGSDGFDTPVCARKGGSGASVSAGCLGGLPYRPAPPVGRHRDADFLYPRTTLEIPARHAP